MELSSVRELKAMLAETVLAPLNENVATRSALGMPVGLVSRATTPETLALGIAPRKRGQYALAVRIQQRALEQGPELDRIRQVARGEVDVRYIGRVVKGSGPAQRQRVRPLRVGSSVGHHKITAGTLGAFVRPRNTAVGGPMILSNNHVLANENRGKAGETILQPGVADGGLDPEDQVAVLGKFLRLKRRGINKVDCALADLGNGIEFDPAALDGIGTLTGLGDVLLDEGEEVAKVGRTTGTTRGRVTAFEVDDLIVGFDMGDIRFDGQIEIEGAGDGPFSQGGDSGSLIVNSDGRGVALLFAGGDQGGTNGKGLTYANPLREVLDALNVDLLF